jgi:ribonuclease HII
MIEHWPIEDMLHRKACGSVCGVDEAGRGPLAGPVVAAAVVLPAGIELDGLDDSKKLTPLRREHVFEQIVALDLPCSVGVIDHGTIDRVNILKASLLAMRKAVMSLKQRPDFVLVDGKHPIPNITQPQFAVVAGDSRCRSIAAASVVAKVTRDRIMDRYQGMYPSFSFASHKGYPTAAHLAELKEHGPCEIHRRSYRPVAEILSQHVLF